MNFQDPFYQDQIRRQVFKDTQHSSVKTYLREKDLQSECETILTRAGYRRLTEKNMVADAWSEVAGWFAHWPQAVGNPIMSDLVVFSQDLTRCLHVELKVHKKFRKAQKAFITTKRWHVDFTPDEFAGHVAEWRSKNP